MKNSFLSQDQNIHQQNKKIFSNSRIHLAYFIIIYTFLINKKENIDMLNSMLTVLILLQFIFAEVTSLSVVTASRNAFKVNVGSMQMKGRKVPIDQRGEFIKQQRILEQKRQLETEKPEGVPIFKIFVRPKAGGLWIPCGDLAGDKRATAVVNAWMSGFMSDMYRDQLDQGIARSLFSQEDSFVQGLIENYKPFKKFTKDQLQFGYKVDFEGLEEKVGEQKVRVIERGMEKSWVDNLKEGFGNLFKNDT